ncbi:MAG TPA: hypothetical protein VEG44_01710 [Candidatus Acidoferrales bacterium]|nr:hypothetical protein [Candidatus Acidoferrales bacterium]
MVFVELILFALIFLILTAPAAPVAILGEIFSGNALLALTLH